MNRLVLDKSYTGDLVGIAGSLEIDVADDGPTHSYKLSYEIRS